MPELPSLQSVPWITRPSAASYVMQHPPNTSRAPWVPPVHTDLGMRTRALSPPATGAVPPSPSFPSVWEVSVWIFLINTPHTLCPPPGATLASPDGKQEGCNCNEASETNWFYGL